MTGTILVVDDAAETRDLLDGILREEGYRLLFAADGREALALLEKESVDLIITDVMMPEMDGFAFLKALRASAARRRIPVLVLTVRGKMVDTFLAFGVRGFIPKPFDTGELLAAVADCLGGGKEASVASPEGETPGVPDFTPRTVLIAGSHPETRRRMEAILAAHGVETVCVGGVSELESAVAEARPDIIFLDVLLDGMVPRQTVRRLRQGPFGERPLILFCRLAREQAEGGSFHQLALEIETARSACMEAGATDSMGGFEEDHFKRMLRKYLSSRSGRDGGETV